MKWIKWIVVTFNINESVRRLFQRCNASLSRTPPMPKAISMSIKRTAYTYFSHYFVVFLVRRTINVIFKFSLIFIFSSILLLFLLIKYDRETNGVFTLHRSVGAKIANGDIQRTDVFAHQCGHMVICIILCPCRSKIYVASLIIHVDNFCIFSFLNIWAKSLMLRLSSFGHGSATIRFGYGTVTQGLSEQNLDW